MAGHQPHSGIAAAVTASPFWVRFLPLAIFVGLTSLQGNLGPTSDYWMYAFKTVAGAGLIACVHRHVPEMRWRLSLEAVLAGVLVFVLWVGLDPLYPKIQWGQPNSTWNPFDTFGQESAVAWSLIAIRILGSTWVVPPLEEVFYRSFLYRYLVRADFDAVPLGKFAWMPFLVTSAVFGIVHREWLAGILCGLIYQGLVIRKGRLGDAMAAHAITNCLLGVWVVWKGAWQFW